jgi:hypothetical protein
MYSNIRTVWNDIIQYLSHHKNKGYREQLIYLKRHMPYIWDHDYPESIIIHLMAISANMSFSMYSD